MLRELLVRGVVRADAMAVTVTVATAGQTVAGAVAWAVALTVAITANWASCVPSGSVAAGVRGVRITCVASVAAAVGGVRVDVSGCYVILPLLQMLLAGIVACPFLSVGPADPSLGLG